jgi:outer membrane receptor protein involved in Fe transport
MLATSPAAASAQASTPPSPSSPAQTTTSSAPTPAQPQTPTTTVNVTAYRAPISELESPATTRLLDQQALQSTAGVTLDDELRQIPGLELFRRSSSLVANPTSQGMSLRGLGSTSASRTLVIEDEEPLNDPLGGWIHWQELPALTIRQVELVRGGASDLYGSSAIGGVVNVAPLTPTANAAQLRSSYGGEETWDDDLMAETVHGPWGMLFGTGALGTDGYIQEAPAQRGPVDQPSNVHSQNGLLLADRKLGALRMFVRGSGFNEDRNNGTPYQKNSTQLFRYATGGDWSAPHDATFALRLYGADERYHQTFSSISNLPNFGVATCSYRCGEIPTRYSQVPDNELGAAAHWSQPLGAGLLILAGADTHDLRIWDREQTYGSTAALTNLHDHQRDSAAYGEAVATHKAWTLTASARLDWFQNFDGQLLDFTGSAWMPAAKQPVQQSLRVFDPRVGLARKLSAHWALSASGFRAFRAPTPNELYRSTQVGNQLTRPNGTLLAERATGWEAGLAAQHNWGVVRASYFLTQVNRPISAVTTNPNSSPILLMRENLGQIESKGVSVDLELTPWHFLALDGGYQYAHATVTRGTAATGQTDLGNWIPEVARNLATLNLRASRPKLGLLSLEGRLSGRQFDDDANTYLLHGYFRLDAYASHDLGRRWQLFAAGENLLNRQIEVALTPTETLGTPRVARAGFLLRLGAPAK